MGGDVIYAAKVIELMQNDYGAWLHLFDQEYAGYGSTPAAALNDLAKHIDNHAVQLLQAIKDVKAQAREAQP